MSSKFPIILITVGILLALVAGKIWYDLHDKYPIVNYPPKGGTIVAFGDSLTVGVGASSPEKGYVNILEERLGTPIINKGVVGNTTEDALRRLDADVLVEKPDIVLLLFGSNDYLKGIQQEVTFNNLRSIIERTQASGAVIVLIGARGGLLSDKFSRDFEKLAKESGSLFVPGIMDGIIGETSLMSDEIHPNDAGYLKMADKIAPVLLSVVFAAKDKEGVALEPISK
jgi:lysophospholipase L1-like esterase